MGMEYLIILAAHHEQMKIPSTLLGTMGEWLDDVFCSYFDEEVYVTECSDGIQFIYAFVGEVMSGAYSKPIYDVNCDENADEIDENVSSSTHGTVRNYNRMHQSTLSTQLQFELPNSLMSVAAQMDDDVTEDDGLFSHYYNDSNGGGDGNTPLPNHYNHVAQPSISLNLPRDGIGAISTTLSAQKGAVHDVTHLDLEQHPSLT